MEEDDFADFDASLDQVPEGQRNSIMSHIAGKIIKRYGNTEEAYQLFLKKSELCNPLLPEKELNMIRIPTWSNTVFTKIGGLIPIMT